MTVETTLLIIFASLAMGIAAWLLFLWAVKTDQYDDVERPKHRMLDDEPEEPAGQADPADPDRGDPPPSKRT